MPPQSPPDGRCPPVPSRSLPLDIEAFCAHPCAPVVSLTLILFPFQTLLAGLRQVIIMQELSGIGKGLPVPTGAHAHGCRTPYVLLVTSLTAALNNPKMIRTQATNMSMTMIVGMSTKSPTGASRCGIATRPAPKGTSPPDGINSASRKLVSSLVAGTVRLAVSPLLRVR